jgi:hypothetical protein
MGSIKWPRGYFDKVLVTMVSSFAVKDTNVIVSVKVPVTAVEGSTSSPIESVFWQLLKIKRLINKVNKSSLYNFIRITLNFKSLQTLYNSR